MEKGAEAAKAVETAMPGSVLPSSAAFSDNGGPDDNRPGFATPAEAMRVGEHFRTLSLGNPACSGTTSDITLEPKVAETVTVHVAGQPVQISVYSHEQVYGGYRVTAVVTMQLLAAYNSIGTLLSR